MRTVCVYALVAACLILVGCFPEKPPKAADLVGRWEHVRLPWTFVFEANGQVSMSTIGPAKRGTYRLDAAGNLFIDLNDGRKYRSKVSIRGNEMTMTDPDGATSRFRRVP